MSLPSHAEKLIDASAENIIEVDDFVASKREDFATLYAELLNSPERRDDRIEAKYINYFFQQSVVELGDESMLGYWQSVADSMDRTWDELNSIPPNKRGGTFSAVRSIMSAAAWEQAFIESGLALEMVERGLTMGDMIAKEVPKFDPKKIVGGTGIKNLIDDKLKNRTVGTAKSKFTAPDDGASEME